LEAVSGGLATGWAIALGEPTPFGEIVMGLVTLGVGIGCLLFAKEASKPKAIPKTKEKCKEKEKKPCPPCNPPVGTVGYEIHRVPHSRLHWPCPGDHVHWFERHQNSYNCQCFWKRDFILPTCLEQGDYPELPPGAFPL